MVVISIIQGTINMFIDVMVIYLFLFIGVLFGAYYILKAKKKKRLNQLVAIIIASFFMAFGVKLLVQPSTMLTGGVGGIALIISRVAAKGGISLELESLIYSISYFLINIPILILGYRRVGKEFTILSLLNVVFYTLFINLIPFELGSALHLDKILSPLDISILAGLIVGFGVSFAFLNGFSSAGTDIISMYLMNKKGSNVGSYSFIINIFIMSAAVIIFKDIPSLIYTIVYIFISTLVINFIYVRNKKVVISVVSNNAKNLAEELLRKTKHSCTIINVTGAYSKQLKQQLTMVISYNELKEITDLILAVDHTSFISVLEVRALHGRFYLPPIE